MALLIGIFDQLHAWLLSPGELVLTKLPPDLVEKSWHLTISSALSLAVWFTLVLIVWKTFRLTQAGIRTVRSQLRTIWFRQLTKKACQTSPAGSAGDASDAADEIEFDQLDLAVLSSAMTQAPGHALAAPDLTEQLKLPPGRIQRSLDKLSTNMMLEHSFGTVDEYACYRITEAGATFLALWQRKKTESRD